LPTGWGSALQRESGSDAQRAAADRRAGEPEVVGLRKASALELMDVLEGAAALEQGEQQGEDHIVVAVLGGDGAIALELLPDEGGKAALFPVGQRDLEATMGCISLRLLDGHWYNIHSDVVLKSNSVAQR